jgi:hypothetical protein
MKFENIIENYDNLFGNHKYLADTEYKDMYK